MTTTTNTVEMGAPVIQEENRMKYGLISMSESAIMLTSVEVTAATNLLGRSAQGIIGRGGGVVNCNWSQNIGWCALCKPRLLPSGPKLELLTMVSMCLSVQQCLQHTPSPS